MKKFVSHPNARTRAHEPIRRPITKVYGEARQETLACASCGYLTHSEGSTCPGAGLWRGSISGRSSVAGGAQNVPRDSGHTYNPGFALVLAEVSRQLGPLGWEIIAKAHHAYIEINRMDPYFPNVVHGVTIIPGDKAKNWFVGFGRVFEGYAAGEVVSCTLKCKLLGQS